MTEPQENLFGLGRKVYRRKRRYQGASWTPPSMSSDVEDGLWCRACKQRHGYMTLGLKYEKRRTKTCPEGQWIVVWNCPRTGNVVGETTLNANTRTREVHEQGPERPGEAEPDAAD